MRRVPVEPEVVDRGRHEGRLKGIGIGADEAVEVEPREDLAEKGEPVAAAAAIRLEGMMGRVSRSSSAEAIIDKHHPHGRFRV